MTTAAAVLRHWLLRPSRTSAVRGYALFVLLLGPIGLAGSLYYLISGHPQGGHGGRLAALLLMGYAAMLTALLVRIWRAGSQVWHLVLAVLVINPGDWIDSWVYEPQMRWAIPGVPLLLALGLIVNLVRYARKASRPRVAEGVEPQRPSSAA